MRGNKSSNSRPEVALRSALHRAGLRFRKHLRPVRDLRCVADVVFPTERIAVFLDGCYWHRCPAHGTQPTTNGVYWTAKLNRNVDRDTLVNAELRSAGWTVLRIWEHVPPAEAARRIASALDLWG